jgi:hypothetical protein
VSIPAKGLIFFLVCAVILGMTGKVEDVWDMVYLLSGYCFAWLVCWVDEGVQRYHR